MDTQFDQALGLRFRQFLGRESVLGQRRQPGLGPVSYTHLRAHETVLDLVCRLLLEKKKKAKRNYSVCLTPKGTQHVQEQNVSGR